MHLFIDESGNFTSSRPSVVGLLILPDHDIARIYRAYGEIRPLLPRNKRGEVKGAKLNEQQVGAVIKILSSHDGIFEASAFIHGKNASTLENNKRLQAELFIQSLTESHQPNVRAFASSISERLLNLPPQLYAQSVTMLPLIDRGFKIGCMYWSQRNTKELAQFKWVIDAKETKEQTSNWQQLWQDMLLPLLQAMAIKTLSTNWSAPSCGDFTGMKRHMRDTMPEHLVQHFPHDKESGAISLGTVFKDLRYSDKIDYGLELVDILTSTVRRALIGNLQPYGWWGLPTLMLHRDHPYIEAIVVDKDVIEDQQVWRALMAFRLGGKPMFTPESKRQIKEMA